jgi:hypothetical protein
MRLMRRRVDTSSEEKILTAFIVSSKFCKEVFPITNIEYFQTDYAKKIVAWTSEYFDKYQTCPDRQIKEIFNYHKPDLKEADAENIGLFLAKLSDQYETDDKFNSDYYIDQAVEYYRGQAVRVIVEKSKVLLDIGKLDDAEQLVRDYKKVAKETSEWINPLDKNFIRKTLLEDQNKDVLFSFPGALGHVLGKLERGWLIGILGPMKRGKTWYLQEFAMHALFERLNVVFISLEMDSSRVAKRIYKRLTAYGEEEKNYAYPTFDCKRNQDNTCTLGERTNHIKLLDEKGQKPTFHPDMKYRVCSVCRGKRKRFSADAWFIIHKREKLKIRNAVKKIQGMEQLFGSNLRLLSYPAYSANITKVKRDIDKLEYIEGFVPDVVVIDYADILAPEDSRQVGRERSDETWKMLKNLSQSKHSLVVTASQSNRSSISKKNVTQTDIAEDIRKIAHVDMMISLNQLPDEKRFGIMRIAVIAHREKDFDQLSQCMVLQQLELGQPQLDSELCNDFKEIQNLREKIADEDIF